MSNIYELGSDELRYILWEHLGIRASRTVSNSDMHKLLHYELYQDETPPNPINDMRDLIMRFITANKNRLSIPCDGNCYAHSDGVVLACYRQLKEDTNDKETIHEENATGS